MQLFKSLSLSRDEAEFCRLHFLLPSSCKAFTIWGHFSHKDTSHTISNEVLVGLKTFVGFEVFFTNLLVEK